jgi:hypothetical protein
LIFEGLQPTKFGDKLHDRGHRDQPESSGLRDLRPGSIDAKPPGDGRGLCALPTMNRGVADEDDTNLCCANHCREPVWQLSARRQIVVI